MTNGVCLLFPPKVFDVVGSSVSEGEEKASCVKLSRGAHNCFHLRSPTKVGITFKIVTCQTEPPKL